MSDPTRAEQRTMPRSKLTPSLISNGCFRVESCQANSVGDARWVRGPCPLLRGNCPTNFSHLIKNGRRCRIRGQSQEFLVIILRAAFRAANKPCTMQPLDTQGWIEPTSNFRMQGGVVAGADEDVFVRHVDELCRCAHQKAKAASEIFDRRALTSNMKST